MPQIDSKAFYKLSYGLYLLSTKWQGKDNACIVDAVIQSAAEPKCITVSCMADNYTPELIRSSRCFNLSVLAQDTPAEFFQRFGMQSGRSADKFADLEGFERTGNDLLYSLQASAVVSCEVIETLELGSHVQITARVVEARCLRDAPSLTYAEYRARLKAGSRAVLGKGAPELAGTAVGSVPALQAARAEEAPAQIAQTRESAQPVSQGEEGTPMSAKWVCKVCGYIYEGPEPPAECPVCHAPASMFEKVEGELKLAAEHEYGVYAKTVKNNENISDEDKQYILDQLKANFTGECSEVGMYLCMARIACREGYPEIGEYWKTAAFEEAEHAAKFAELLGSELEPHMTASTKENLAWRVDCEFGATAGKVELATCAKKNGLDAIHDTVHEMARDEARHGKALKGMLERYF